MGPTDARADAAASRALIVGLGGLVLVASGYLFGAWIMSRGDLPFTVDSWWDQLVAQWWLPFLGGLARVMNWLGGGWFASFALPILAAGALIGIKRLWSAVYFLAAELASVIVVQVLKHVFERVRPEDMLVVSDEGSYPSGHVANAATIAVAAVVLFPRVWVAIVAGAWVLMMAFSRTYLHAHWLSDTLGGVLVGSGVALIVAAAFWVPIARERALPVSFSVRL
ncbi:phosphatase PAP2 family protein [Microbacterium sp. BWT-B31]|uniref:phosphatase PAP2 family protein n=1 Tax=Microbacterium sp. BWT-B31 TaxID=3232072 RepID=UPI003527BA15